jgi:hypothetical protein
MNYKNATFDCQNATFRLLNATNGIFDIPAGRPRIIVNAFPMSRCYSAMRPAKARFAA